MAPQRISIYLCYSLPPAPPFSASNRNSLISTSWFSASQWAFILKPAEMPESFQPPLYTFGLSGAASSHLLLPFAAFSSPSCNQRDQSANSLPPSPVDTESCTQRAQTPCRNVTPSLPPVVSTDPSDPLQQPACGMKIKCMFTLYFPRGRNKTSLCVS